MFGSRFRQVLRHVGQAFLRMRTIAVALQPGPGPYRKMIRHRGARDKRCSQGNDPSRPAG